MQNISRVVVSFVYYASLLRDTLEYTLPRDSYDVKFYEYKKNGIINELQLNTPLKNFIENNTNEKTDAGKKLKERLETLGHDLYSDESTVIKVANEGLRVDHAQHIKIFEEVIPAYRELNNIINIHVNYARDHQAEISLPQDELNKLYDLRLAANRFFTAVGFLSLSREIFKLFEEFQKLRRESNGERTPQSNFVEQDLNKLTMLLDLVRRDCMANDAIYTDAMDALFHAVEIMSGRRQVPTGKTFADCMNDANVKISAFVKDAEDKYKVVYPPLLNELISDAAKLREANAAANNNTQA